MCVIVSINDVISIQIFLPACGREASPDLDFHFHGVYLPEIKELLPNYLNAWKYELLALQQLDL